MKVFEVITERSAEGSKEIIKRVQYVTSEHNSILHVTKYFSQQCEELEEGLISVKEVLVISSQLGK